MFLFSCNKSAFVFGLLRRRNASSLFEKKKKEREGVFRVLFQFSPSSQSVAAKFFPHFFQKADLSRVLLSRVSQARYFEDEDEDDEHLPFERERGSNARFCVIENLNRYIFILQAFLSDGELESKK